MLDESAADRNSVGVGLGGKAQVLEVWLLFLVAGEVAVVVEQAAEGRSLIDSDRLSGQPELMRRTSSVVVRVVDQQHAAVSFFHVGVGPRSAPDRLDEVLFVGLPICTMRLYLRAALTAWRPSQILWLCGFSQ